MGGGRGHILNCGEIANTRIIRLRLSLAMPGNPASICIIMVLSGCSSNLIDIIRSLIGLYPITHLDVSLSQMIATPFLLKGMVLYSAVSSPLDRSKRFTLSSPGRPVHSDTVLGFSWKHSSHAAIAQRLFTHISTTVYSQVLIYTAESTEASWSERKCPNFDTVTTGFEPGLSRLRVRHSTNWATALLTWSWPQKNTLCSSDWKWPISVHVSSLISQLLFFPFLSWQYLTFLYSLFLHSWFQFYDFCKSSVFHFWFCRSQWPHFPGALM